MPYECLTLQSGSDILSLNVGRISDANDVMIMSVLKSSFNIVETLLNNLQTHVLININIVNVDWMQQKGLRHIGTTLVNKRQKVSF